MGANNDPSGEEADDDGQAEAFAQGAGETGRELHEIPSHLLNGRYDDGFGVSNMQVHFDALLRLLDREEPDYKT
jgi:hypothetical protein